MFIAICLYLELAPVGAACRTNVCATSNIYMSLLTELTRIFVP